MGKGSNTVQNNVVKRLSKLTADKSLLLKGVGLGGAAGAGKERTINQCMIKFNLTATDETGTLKLGDSVTLVPEGATGVQIIHRGRKIASYTGDLSVTLAECMRAGYIYKGEVTDSDSASNNVTCQLQAYGKV